MISLKLCLIIWQVLLSYTMDDALNWKKDNEKLTIQLESMVGFQSMACSEIADLKMEIKELRDQLNDSCRLDKIEQIKKLINTI